MLRYCLVFMVSVSLHAMDNYLSFGKSISLIEHATPEELKKNIHLFDMESFGEQLLFHAYNPDRWNDQALSKFKILLERIHEIEWQDMLEQMYKSLVLLVSLTEEYNTCLLQHGASIEKNNEQIDFMKQVIVALDHKERKLSKN